MAAFLRFTQFIQKLLPYGCLFLQLWRYGSLNFCLAQSIHSMDFGDYYARHGNDHDR